ncbi:MAG: hypothetical protein WCF20_06465 [Methylovirgula sp.]
MAIEALYPSRRQSQRHNPLFARERQARRLGLIAILALSLLGLFGLRSGPAGAAAEARTISDQGDRGALAAPFAPRRIFMRETSASDGSTLRTSRKPVRVIPLFAVPEDAAAVAPHQGQDG